MTLAVVSGWLLTVANTGDSNAIIDCGDSVQEITHSHRIQVGCYKTVTLFERCVLRLLVCKQRTVQLQPQSSGGCGDPACRGSHTATTSRHANFVVTVI
jgi:hypothetical protein